MLIKNGIIFIWTGTHALIPSGWSRVTDMDDKYPKGTASATNPNTTGGAATHTHTSPAHTHTAQAHTHALTISAGIGGGQGTNNGGGPIQSHSHGALTSGSIAGFSCSSPASTYGSVSNHPLFYTIIYVSPTTFSTVIPTGIIGLADAAAPTGFNICDGTNSTPNLVDKYLLGASAGADAGTTGGSVTNVHALSHTHSLSHYHSAVTSGGSTPNAGATQNAAATATDAHTHSVQTNSDTTGTTDNVSLTTAETVEPAHTKLLAIQSSGNLSAPLGIIALWKGLLSAIPIGWKLCDGDGGTIDMRDRHLKITGTVGSVGTTGGSNTHTHASQTHSHTVSHSHTVNNLSHNATRDTQSSTPQVSTKSATYHTVTSNIVNLTLDNASTTADSSNNEPPYRTVAFIKFVSNVSPASFIFNML